MISGCSLPYKKVGLFRHTVRVPKFEKYLISTHKQQKMLRIEVGDEVATRYNYF